VAHTGERGKSVSDTVSRMSLSIDTDRVAAVLLPVVGWTPVDRGDDGVSTFDLDAYEFVWEGRLVLGGGQESEAGVPATGFAFRSGGVRVSGPLTSVLAVRHDG